jgi:hypothetical protein
MPLCISRRTAYSIGNTVGIYRRTYSVGIYRRCYRRSMAVGIYRRFLRRNYFRRYIPTVFETELFPSVYITDGNILSVIPLLFSGFLVVSAYIAACFLHKKAPQHTKGEANGFCHSGCFLGPSTYGS